VLDGERPRTDIAEDVATAVSLRLALL
jgi:hypothetical protein